MVIEQSTMSDVARVRTNLASQLNHVLVTRQAVFDTPYKEDALEKTLEALNEVFKQPVNQYSQGELTRDDASNTSDRMDVVPSPSTTTTTPTTPPPPTTTPTTSPPPPPPTTTTTTSTTTTTATLATIITTAFAAATAVTVASAAATVAATTAAISTISAAINDVTTDVTNTAATDSSAAGVNITSIPPAVVTSTSTSTEPIIPIRRAKEPVNEFLENDKLFLGSYPLLFFLGEGWKGSGSADKTFINHLLYQHDGRFAQCIPLLFTLFNQKQRHIICKAIKAR